MPRVESLRRYFKAWMLSVTNPRLPLSTRQLANRGSCIYPELGIHFDRIPKNANTFLFMLFDQIRLGIESVRDREVARRDIIAPIDLSLKTDLRKYRHVVVVRDPFSRCLSMFLQKIEPGISTNYSYLSGYGVHGKEGFRSFLMHLSSRNTLYSNYHFWPQVDCFTLKDIKNYDYTLRFENLNSDLIKMLKSLDIEFDSDEQQIEVAYREKDKVKLTNSRKKMPQYFDAHTEKLVRDIYKKDFCHIGYPQKSVL